MRKGELEGDSRIPHSPLQFQLFSISPLVGVLLILPGAFAIPHSAKFQRFSVFRFQHLSARTLVLKLPNGLAFAECS
jgi:hypothetical protein